MICIVAPYSPVGTPSPNLGAARKIETILAILARIDPDIVLVNSAHNLNRPCKMESGRSEIAGISLIEIRPQTYFHRSMGKFLNLFEVFRIARLVREMGHCHLVWLYNGYSFESLFLISASIGFRPAIILEFEDWHYSRKRRFSVKPHLDFLLWRLSIKRVTAALCVNEQLAGLVRSHGVIAHEVPGVVSTGISALAKEPVHAAEVIIGYFGGLSIEKGAKEVAEAVLRLDGRKFIVCGTGPELTTFIELASKYPDRLELYSGIGFRDMLELMGRCSILLNPHRVTHAFLHGLFPSKVLEYIASGRLVISTELPKTCDTSVLREVLFYDGSVIELVLAISRAEEIINNAGGYVSKTASEAERMYGTHALKRRIEGILSSVTKAQQTA